MMQLRKSFKPWNVDEADTRSRKWMPMGRLGWWWLWGILILILAGCGGKKPLPYTIEPRSKIQGVYHVVERGQTFWRICKAYNVNMQYVAEVNNIRDMTQIETGQKIFIPGATRPLKVIPYRPPTKGAEEPVPRIETFKGKFIWPVRGRVTSTFGVRNGIKHAGIDIAAPLGALVSAAASGQVLHRGQLRGYGRILILKHDGEYSTVYAHLKEWLVRDGQYVKQGEPIAAVGKSGRSSGSHLHFEVRYQNKVRNPLFYLP